MNSSRLIILLASLCTMKLCLFLFLRNQVFHPDKLRSFIWEETQRYEDSSYKFIYTLQYLASNSQSNIPETILPHYNKQEFKEGYRFKNILEYYKYLSHILPPGSIPDLPDSSSFPDSLSNVVLSNFADIEISKYFDQKGWLSPGFKRPKLKMMLQKIDETDSLLTIEMEPFDIFPDSQDLEVQWKDSFYQVKHLPILLNDTYKHLTFRIKNKNGESQIFNCN